MPKPLTLKNGKSWRTQALAKGHFKDMLARHKNGQKVTDPSDHGDLLALLDCYDRDVLLPRETKTGSEVEYFFRDRDTEHPGNTDCFHVRRTDGTIIGFSTIRAVEVASRSQIS